MMVSHFPIDMEVHVLYMWCVSRDAADTNQSSCALIIRDFPDSFVNDN